MLEIVILNRHRDLCYTTSNQFGFKEKLGTELAVFVLKEVIDFYISNSSPIYLCFLDLSKAFDRVNHSLLFTKLHNRGFPALITRILHNWYRYQTCMVRWGNCLSSEFLVANGVRATSPTALQKLTDICSAYFSYHNLGFSLKKTKCHRLGTWSNKCHDGYL